MSQTARLLCGLFLAAFISGGQPALAQTDLPAQAERPGDHALGATDAPLLIIEYASFACPHCAHFQAETWPVIHDEFVATGQVRYVLRPMLTAPAQIAAIGIVLTECAAPDRYFAAADLLFSEQANIFQTAQAQGDVAAIYDRIAAAVGLDAEALNACFVDPAMAELVNVAAVQAGEDGVSSTPSFIIGGRVLGTMMTAEGVVVSWGGEPLLINGGRLAGHLDGDSFRRIILHFLERSNSEPESAP